MCEVQYSSLYFWATVDPLLKLRTMLPLGGAQTVDSPEPISSRWTCRNVDKGPLDLSLNKFSNASMYLRRGDMSLDRSNRGFTSRIKPNVCLSVSISLSLCFSVSLALSGSLSGSGSLSLSLSLSICTYRHEHTVYLHTYMHACTYMYIHVNVVQGRIQDIATGGGS